MKQAELIALEARLKVLLRRRMAGEGQAAHSKHLVRLVEAGIRFGWASRKWFEGPLKPEKVDGLLDQIVETYGRSGFPNYGRPSADG